MKDRFQKQVEERNAHRVEMETNHGLVGHPKAARLYEIAWSLGHSAGYHEVEIYYNEMADLLK